MKPKICYIIDNLILAGAEVHLFNLVKGLKNIGYEDIEVVSMSGEGEIYDWMINLGVVVHNFRMKSIRKPLFLYDFLKLVSLLRKNRPDIVHTYLDTANVFGVLAARLAGVTRIMTSRRDLGVFRSSRMEQIIGKLSNRVEKVVCVCKMAATESIRREGLHGNNIKVIYNGIEIDRFIQQERTTEQTIPIFCNVAVPNRKAKGHEDLINAFAIVLKKLPDARLKLVGDGCLLPELKQQAAELGISANIDFMGTSFDIPGILQDVTAFVLPSHSEGISNALLEAMAMGIPAVVTSVGGNLEVVQDGITGSMVEARNPDSIAQGMLAIVSDMAKLRTMGHAARESVMTDFRFEKMICHYDSLYCGTEASSNILLTQVAR